MDIGSDVMSQDCGRKLQSATREKLRKFDRLRGEFDRFVFFNSSYFAYKTSYKTYK